MRRSAPQIGSRIGDEDIAATGRFELLLSGNRFFVVKLKLVKFAIKAGLFEQSRVRADVHNPAMRHHDNAIRLENGG